MCMYIHMFKLECHKPSQNQNIMQKLLPTEYSMPTPTTWTRLCDEIVVPPLIGIEQGHPGPFNVSWYQDQQQ